MNALRHFLFKQDMITAQWEGMGDVGLARYEPVLLPPWQALIYFYKGFKLQ